MHTGGVLLAYIDEIGEAGAFVSRDHPTFNTSPAFGYAGFILLDAQARAFGAHCTAAKRSLFRTEIDHAEHPGRWERKGSEIFRPLTHEKFPQQLRVFSGLVKRLTRLGGRLFSYADEKPLGTPKQTGLDTVRRETEAMQEPLNRLARHADHPSGRCIRRQGASCSARGSRPRRSGGCEGRRGEAPGSAVWGGTATAAAPPAPCRGDP